MRKLCIRIGTSFLNGAYFYYSFSLFARKIIRSTVKLRFLNPAIFSVTLRQIYFTAVQILPTYIFLSLVMGAALVGILGQFLISIGGADSIGKILTVATVREIGPTATSILLVLRSSSAVTAEIGLMNINREIKTLEALGIDPVHYLYTPRVIAGVVSMLTLSTFFVFISIVGGYALLSFQIDTTLDFIIQQFYDQIAPADIICFLFKTIVQGFLLMAIPIHAALEMSGSTFMIPIMLIKGMMRLFYAGIIIEIIGILI